MNPDLVHLVIQGGRGVRTRERLKYREGDMAAWGTKRGEKGGKSLLSRSNRWSKGLE